MDWVKTVSHEYHSRKACKHKGRGEDSRYRKIVIWAVQFDGWKVDNLSKDGSRPRRLNCKCIARSGTQGFQISDITTFLTWFFILKIEKNYNLEAWGDRKAFVRIIRFDG